MRRSRHRAGFTLFEVLLVVMVIGLLSTMVVGGFAQVVPAAQETAAVNKARILNAARITYGLTVADSANRWAAAAGDPERTTLLVEAGVLSGQAADWLAAPGGYTLTLTGALRAKTVLRDREGTTLAYSD